MKTIFSRCIILLTLVSLPVLAREPHKTPPSPAPAASPQPSPTPTLLSVSAVRVLLREFQRAQANEIKAADHQYKGSLKELKASQAARQKEWEFKEREARHKFFAEHAAGAEKRAYMRDFLDRRKVFLQMLLDEAAQRGREQEVRLRSLKEDQAARLNEAQAALQKGERPADHLWPSGH